MSKAKVTKLKLVPPPKRSCDVKDVLNGVKAGAADLRLLGVIAMRHDGEASTAYAAQTNQERYALIGVLEALRTRLLEDITSDA